MAGQTKALIGKINPKLKGKAYLAAVAKALSPQNIASYMPQKDKQGKKK